MGMLSKENLDEEKFRDVISRMEKAPKIDPPENFTTEVMKRLTEGTVFHRNKYLGMPAGRWPFATDLHFGFQQPVSQNECSLYFFMTGFFYLVFGIILMLGLYPAPAESSSPAWLAIQPLFTLAAAVCLVAIGVALYVSGKPPLGAARFGTTLFAGIVILNGCLGVFFIPLPVVALLSVVFAVTGLIMAVFLGLSIRYYKNNPHFEESWT